MMFYKDARFWISLVTLAGAFALAGFGKVAGGEALAAALGVAGGWGLSKGSNQ